MSERNYYVYILACNSRRLYIGVTNNIDRRVFEHKQKLIDGFTKRYNIDQLVYVENTDNILSAIAREKQLKGWKRERKIALIEESNPEWKDLASDWYTQEPIVILNEATINKQISRP